MVTENVDIRFRETGARVIKRRIDEMGQAANNATRGIFLMQRAIFVLGGAGAIRALSRQVDMLTNYENRLRLTATSAENLEDVQKRLFQVARDSRSSFESVAEIYTRTALSVRELGISQKETIRFSESLSKATIISGASSREAHAAMVQLGQGMASNTLRGDELRSVLEQLPFVADVIGKHFGVTRGELRRLGEEGKISAEAILAAFRKSEKEIDELFANTIPTISQALTVANTNWLQFLDNLDDATSASATLARAIILISQNIGILVGTLGALAGAFALTFAVKTIQRVFDWVAGLKAGAVASARLLEINNLAATGSLGRATAVQTANIADLVGIRQGITQLKQGRAILLQEKAETAVVFEGARARSVLTGQFVSLSAAKANLSRINKALWQTEIALRASGAQLTAGMVAQTGAAHALATANTRLAASQAASATLTARFTRTFPLLAGGIGLVLKGLRFLWAILIANPIGAVITAIGLLIFSLAKFGNQIKITEDGVVGLRDVFQASFELMAETIGPIMDDMIKVVKEKLEEMKLPWIKFKEFFFTTLKDLLKLWYNWTFLLPRLMVGAVFAIIEALKMLPKSFESIMIALTNAAIEGFEDIHNAVFDGINAITKSLNEFIKSAPDVAELLGLSGEIPEIPHIKLPRIAGDPEDFGKQIAEAISKGFKKGFDLTSFENVLKGIGILIKPILDRAREIAERGRESKLDPGGGGGGDKLDPEFVKLLAAMEKQIELLGLSGNLRREANEILKLEKSLKRDLTSIEEKLANVTIKRLLAAKDEAKVMDSLFGPREKAANNIAALNRLYPEGMRHLQDYTDALKKMREEADKVSGTLTGGFRAAISGAVLNASELGDALGNMLVGAANKASDAIVEFAQTGRANIREFFADLFAQLLKLLTQQLLLKLLASLIGGPVAASASAVGGGVGSSFASGGSILPSGPGSTDTQQIFFNKRPDERVDILTPSQQKTQREDSKVSRQSTTAPQDITVVNTIDPKMVLDVLATRAGSRVIRSTMERDPTGFRKALSV